MVPNDYDSGLNSHTEAGAVGNVGYSPGLEVRTVNRFATEFTHFKTALKEAISGPLLSTDAIVQRGIAYNKIAVNLDNYPRELISEYSGFRYHVPLSIQALYQFLEMC